MTNELNLKFIYNKNELPLHGKPKLSIDKDGKYSISFMVGTKKIDSIEILLEERTYVEPEKESKPKTTKDKDK